MRHLPIPSILLALLPVLAIGQTRKVDGTTFYTSPALQGKARLYTDSSGQLRGDNAILLGAQLSDSLRSIRGQLADAPTRLLYDAAGYNGFPVACQIDGLTAAVFGSGATHAGPHTLRYTESLDSGLSWTAALPVDTVPVTSWAFGMLRSGRQCLLVKQASGDVLCAYTRAGRGLPWTRGATFASPYGSGVVFGRIEPLPGGRLLACLENTPSGSVLLRSDDSGLTWRPHAVVTGAGNEFGFCVVSGSTNADAKLVGFMRPTTETRYGFQWRSRDGGLTWDSLGPRPRFSSDWGGCPTDVRRRGDSLYVVSGVRQADYNGMLVATTGPLAAADDPSLWQPTRVFYDAALSYHGSRSDFAYNSIFFRNNRPWNVLYDWNLARPTLAPGTRNIAIFAEPLDGGYYVQTKPVTRMAGTSETFFKLPLQLDGSGRMFRDADSMILIPVNGVYQISGSAEWSTTDTSGTRREIGLYGLSPYDSEPTPSSLSYSRFLDKVINAPTSPAGVIRQTVSATRYLRAGTRIGFYAKHNAGSGRLPVSNLVLVAQKIN